MQGQVAALVALPEAAAGAAALAVQAEVQMPCTWDGQATSQLMRGVALKKHCKAARTRNRLYAV